MCKWNGSYVLNSCMSGSYSWPICNGSTPENKDHNLNFWASGIFMHMLLCGWRSSSWGVWGISILSSISAYYLKLRNNIREDLWRLIRAKKYGSHPSSEHLQLCSVCYPAKKHFSSNFSFYCLQPHR